LQLTGKISTQVGLQPKFLLSECDR